MSLTLVVSKHVYINEANHVVRFVLMEWIPCEAGSVIRNEFK